MRWIGGMDMDCISRCIDDLRVMFHSVVIVSQPDDRHCIVVYQGRLYRAVWDEEQEQYILTPIRWNKG